MNNSTETANMEVHYDVASSAATAASVAVAAVSEIAIRLERKLENQIDSISFEKSQSLEIVVADAFQLVREASAYANKARVAARSVRVVDASSVELQLLSSRAKTMQVNTEWVLDRAQSRIVEFDKVSSRS